MNNKSQEDDSYSYVFGDNAFPFFEEIIIISDREDSSISNYKIEEFNFLEVRNFVSPPDALYHILTRKEQKISYSALILCEQNLDDFDAALLISLIRLHPLGSLFPVVVLLDKPENSEESHFIQLEKMNLLALGACGFLIRPYSAQEIMDISRSALAKYAEEEQKHLRTMQAIDSATDEIKQHFIKTWKQRLINFEKSFVRFFYTPDANASFEEIFLVGKQKYYDRLFNQATQCFERSSVSESPHKADSLIYLYAIQKEQSNPEAGKIYLERAIDAYVEDENWDKVKESTGLFKKDYPDSKNPIFLALKKSFMRTQYFTVTSIVESVKDVIPVEELAEYLVQINGSKNFPPMLGSMLDKYQDLKKVIYESNYKETTLDGEEYKKHQERERTLKYLEMKRQARLSGEEDKFGIKRQPKSTEKITLITPENFSLDFQFDKEAKKKMSRVTQN